MSEFLNESKFPANIYHLSQDNLGEKILSPRIPSYLHDDENMKKNQDVGLYEKNSIPRVSFSSDIQGCLRAIIPDLNANPEMKNMYLGKTLYVHVPENPYESYKRISNKEIIKNKYVFDAEFTKEEWVVEPVKLKCIGQIKILSISSSKNVKIDQKTNFRLQTFEYQWWTQNESLLNESNQESIERYKSILEDYKIEKETGCYGKNGIWNSLVVINGKNYRKRLECLIIKDNKVFLSKDKKGNFVIPGGSAEKDIDDTTQVCNECREEARIVVKNVRKTNIDYLIYEEPKEYMKDLEIKWVGKYTQIFIADYQKHYSGEINPEDLDENILNTGKFYEISKVFSSLRKEWQLALKPYTDNSFDESLLNEEASEFINNIGAYHLEPKIGNEKITTGCWDEGLYSRSIESAINNDIKSNYKTKDLTTVYAYVFTAGENLKPIYLGVILIPDKNNISDWKWDEKTLLSDDDVNYLKNNPIGESYIGIGENMNMIINKKDLEVNLDKFESGEENILLITGLSGSGKSTLAEKISSKYKCTYYELDCLTFYMKGLLTKEDAIGGEEGLLAFIESKNLKPDKNISYKTGAALYREYIEFIINWCKRQKNKKFIIEGLQIYEVYEDGDTFITSCPIIIKGTSGLVSSIRAAKRNDGSFFKEFGPLLKWVLQDVKYIEKLRKAVSESYIEEAKASYSDSFDDVMDIVDTLPKNELKYICNGSFKNSPYVIYREVLKVNNIPVAFIEIYRFDKGNIGTIVLASRHGHGNKYRRKGYTSEILKRAIEWAHQDNTINKLVYPVKLDNSKSMNLAHKFGFSHPEEDTCPDDKIELELIVDSDLYESYIDQDTISNRDKALEMKAFYEGYASDEVILQEMKRSILPDEVFGIPELRKYPMPDRKHVLSAIRFFNHVDYKYERQLANKIIANMKKYDIDSSHVGKDNRLRKYLPKDIKDLAVKEIYEDDVHEDFLSQKSKPAKNQRAHVSYLKNKRKTHINNKATAVNTLSGNNSPSFQFQNSAAILHDDLFNYLIESENTKERKRPIFIVTSWTNTVFGKIISKWTKSTYTHAAIGFDTKLDKLYSYNADNKINKLGGFSVESIDEYRNIYEDSQICVSTFFVKESDFHKIKEGLDRLENNLKKTKYDFINILNIFFNRAVEVGAKGQEVLSLVCSEFVAWLISLADINIVDKPINLITPKDLSNFNNLKIYKLYEGYVRNYDKNKIDRIFNNLKKTANVIKESMIIEYMEMKKK